MFSALKNTTKHGVKWNIFSGDVFSAEKCVKTRHKVKSFQRWKHQRGFAREILGEPSNRQTGHNIYGYMVDILKPAYLFSDRSMVFCKPQIIVTPKVDTFPGASLDHSEGPKVIIWKELRPLRWNSSRSVYLDSCGHTRDAVDKSHCCSWHWGDGLIEAVL